MGLICPPNEQKGKTSKMEASGSASPSASSNGNVEVFTTSHAAGTWLGGTFYYSFKESLASLLCVLFPLFNLLEAVSLLFICLQLEVMKCFYSFYY